MLKLLCLVVLIKLTSSSFCGDQAVSFALEVSPSGSLSLGCGFSKCLGWDPDTEEAQSLPRFYKINGRVDGYVKKFGTLGFKASNDTNDTKINCTSFTEERCSNNQWVGGIGAVWNDTSEPLALACCSFEDSAKGSSDQGVAVIKAGQKWVGGEVQDSTGQVIAFDYISNLKKISDNETSYYVNIRRFYCPQTSLKPKFLKEILKTPKLYQAPLQTLVGDAIAVGQREGVLDSEISPPDARRIDSEDFQQTLATQNQQEVNTQPLAQVQPEIQASSQNQASIPVDPQTQAQPQPSPADFQAPLQNQAPLNPPVNTYQPVSSNPQYGYSNYYYPTLLSPTCNFYCFSADSIVSLKDGSQKRMDKLEINDWVLSSDGERIGYSTDNPVSTKQITQDMVYADEIQLNDCLYSHNTEGLFVKERVIKLENVEKKGIYAPMTSSTTIVVNDIMASCFNIVKNDEAQSIFSSLIKWWSSNYWEYVFENSRKTLDEIELIPGIQIFVNLFQIFTSSS